MRAKTLLALAAATLLTGCLLPQPDTPIIPPLMPQPRAGVPAAAPAADQTAMVGAPEAALTKDVPAEETRLVGRLSGLAVERVTAVPLAEGMEKVTASVSDLRFELGLLGGDYWLDFALENGETLRLERPLAVAGGQTREIAIELTAGTATLVEEVPLVAPASDAVPVEEPVATP